MKVFVTGASGFIGSQVVKQLLDAGHQVLGLARSDESAKSLIAAGAEAHKGSLEDLDSLRSGAKAADAVIHLGFIHDFSKFAENCEIDRRAIETLGDALAGTDRPLIVSSGIGPRAEGRIATEDTDAIHNPRMPRLSEETALAQSSKGVRVSVVRLPQVHDPRKQGLVTWLISLAREKGVSAYIGDGKNQWAAAHVLDVALLYRLVLEKGTAGGRYHAVGEEGVTLRAIAESIGRGLKLSVVSKSAEEAAAHFGFIAGFAGVNMPASSALTQKWMDWHPKGPGLIADLDHNEF
jgi:nucleoside-diphosphate-sugar epimerase